MTEENKKEKRRPYEGNGVEERCRGRETRGGKMKGRRGGRERGEKGRH